MKLGMDVLVAHRDPQLRMRIGGVLEGAGHRVGTATDPAAAVDACREHDPDVVFLQADGGLEALDAIKADAEAFTIAVVLVGPPAVLADSTALLRRGAHEVLLEPVRDEDVVPRCSGAVKVRHLQEAVLDLDTTVAAVSHVDPLTGLHNRSFVFEQFTALVNLALRHGRPLSAILADVDQIPAIDERGGLAAGDEALEAVGTCIDGRLRDGDVAGRIERGDFLILLPETTGEEAERAAAGLRSCVAAQRIMVGGRQVRATLSTGCVELDPKRPDDFLPDVHRALEAARRQPPASTTV